jgi:hypothetical protein
LSRQGGAESGPAQSPAGDFVSTGTAGGRAAFSLSKTEKREPNMDDEEQKVRELAYDLWDQAGRPNGSAEDFWFAAKQQLAAPDGQPEFANAPQAMPARAPAARLSEPGKTRQAGRKSR